MKLVDFLETGRERQSKNEHHVIQLYLALRIFVARLMVRDDL